MELLVCNDEWEVLGFHCVRVIVGKWEMQLLWLLLLM